MKTKTPSILLILLFLLTACAQGTTGFPAAGDPLTAKMCALSAT